MIRIIFFKRSILFVLLVSSSANPLLAVEPKSHSIVKNNREVSRIPNDLKNILLDKGLEKEIATSKINKLFKDNEYKADKLLHLCNNSNLSISKENLYNALSRYALHEKYLDLNSYSSLIGLVQSITLQPLDRKKSDYISNIASLS